MQTVSSAWLRFSVISLLCMGAGLLGVTRGLTRQSSHENPPPGAKAASSGRVVNSAVIHDFLAQQLRFTWQELLQAQAELRKLRAETNVLRAREKSFATLPIEESTIQEALNDNLEYSELASEANRLRDDIESNSAVLAAGKKHPAVQAQQRQLEVMEKELAVRRLTLRSQFIERQREKAREELVQTRIVPLEERMAILKELEKILISDIASLEAKFGSSRPSADALEQRVDRLEELQRQLGKAIEELRMSIKKGS